MHVSIRETLRDLEWPEQLIDRLMSQAKERIHAGEDPNIVIYEELGLGPAFIEDLYR